MMAKHILTFFSRQQTRKSYGSPILAISCILTLLIILGCGTSPSTNQQGTVHRNIHPIVLDAVHMFDTKQGWALGMNDQAQISGIVRTTDGGQNWQDMTPAGYTLHEPQAAFFRQQWPGW